jgi:hypothetical protein
VVAFVTLAGALLLVATPLHPTARRVNHRAVVERTFTQRLATPS